MQAALGLSQIDKLPHFIARRKENFAYLKERLSRWRNFWCFPKRRNTPTRAGLDFPSG